MSNDDHKDRVIFAIFIIGFLFIMAGAALDRVAMVLAGFFFVWLARELDP